MALSKRYEPQQIETALVDEWLQEGIYHFSGDGRRPVFTIDTPPPTVSGLLHLGHVYSYSQTDFIARYRRMHGDDVLYPMGYDDNGLPTERLVEQTLGVRAAQIGRQAFTKKCLLISEEAEQAYQELWQRLGLSIDWRHTYRTIDENSRRLSQLSFIDLYEKGLAYRREAPTIWCPECQTAIAQAELDDLERDSEFVTISFAIDDGSILPVATTRPELLPACVAIFVHPEDDRYTHLIGRQATVPLFGQSVQVRSDKAAEPDKGTGAVMCCTFGDATDVSWWYTYDLNQIEAISRNGRMTTAAGDFTGLSVSEARRQIISTLVEDGLLSAQVVASQTIRIHERCDTPIEYVVTTQWFIRVLEYKDDLLAAGKRVRWYPDHMKNRYSQWVENLNWDWCISRQRCFGVAFPVWYCDRCGEVVIADRESLPIDPEDVMPSEPCNCGGTGFKAEQDVMDTWATSSMTPQIIGQMTGTGGFEGQRFQPAALRPQAHEIIRTWAFYSILKAFHHFGELPWVEVAISGWGLAPEGTGKISKSRGGGPASPLAMIERYSADAVRYWAASTGLGKDAIIDEEKIRAGSRLVNKLWNVALFSQHFLDDYRPPDVPPHLSLSDSWILDRLHKTISQICDSYQAYDYAAAKNEAEAFFWKDLADNYLELIKKRMYDADEHNSRGARYALYNALLVSIKLLAPVLPFVTESIYLGLFAGNEDAPSIHNSPWPEANNQWANPIAAVHGRALLQVAASVRRFKSSNKLSLGTQIERLHLTVSSPSLRQAFEEARDDIASISRARHITIGGQPDPELLRIPADGPLSVWLSPPG